MRSFNFNQEVEVNFDISFDDIYQEMTDEDIKDVIQVLVEDGHILPQMVSPSNRNMLDDMFIEKLTLLSQKRLFMTDEELTFIDQLGAKYQ